MNTDDESAARSALAIAERLGDHELRCTMLHSIAYVAAPGQGLSTGPAP